MTSVAERGNAMRERRHTRGLRERRLIVSGASSERERQRVATRVAMLNRSRELDAMKWIEAVSEFDTP